MKKPSKYIILNDINEVLKPGDEVMTESIPFYRAAKLEKGVWQFADSTRFPTMNEWCAYNFESLNRTYFRRPIYKKRVG